MKKVCLTCKKKKDCSGTCGLYCKHCKSVSKMKYIATIIPLRRQSSSRSYPSRTKHLFKGKITELYKKRDQLIKRKTRRRQVKRVNRSQIIRTRNRRSI